MIEEDELWDYYSGLPSPLWYKYKSEIKDEEEDTNDSTDSEITYEQDKA